jgi:hypothetical protein
MLRGFRAPARQSPFFRSPFETAENHLILALTGALLAVAGRIEKPSVTVQPFGGSARSALDQSQGGAWVEGALTSGCGLGAICRPLTDWPQVEARLLRRSSLHSHFGVK